MLTLSRPVAAMAGQAVRTQRHRYRTSEVCRAFIRSQRPPPDYEKRSTRSQMAVTLPRSRSCCRRSEAGLYRRRLPGQLEGPDPPPAAS